MAENSLFAILLRSPWWISAAIAAGVAGLAALLVPPDYVVFGAFAALPFVVIAVVALWRQARTPSAARVDRTLASLRELSSADFARLVDDALRADGYDVEPAATPHADFEATKAGRRTLVHCRRWKVARTGVNPLRELSSATRSREASDAIYIAAGEVTAQARTFAAQNAIRLIDGTTLVQWLPAVRGRDRRARAPAA
jgi:restriction system protein